MLGERLSSLVDFESLKLAAGAVLLSPYIPLLFMGEEYGETAPFLYFISHGDPALIEAVRRGRKEEFREFAWIKEPPDPQDLQTFLNSKIRWEARKNGKQKILLSFYQDLITIRKEVPALSNLDKRCLDVCAFEDDRILFMKRWENDFSPDIGRSVLCIFSFNQEDKTLFSSPYGGRWRKIFDSSDDAWHGPGVTLPENISSGQEITIRGRSLAVYTSEEGSTDELHPKRIFR
jgi:maltooligosyltrehalose trehalohydrolase